MEREEFKNKLEEQFLYLHLRIERLEKSIPHTAGSLVWKGDRKQYAYWQFYQNKVKVQKSVAKDQIEATKRQIEILRHQQEKLRELLQFRKKLQHVLLIFHMTGEEILQEYYQRERKRIDQEKAYQKAKQLAEAKWHRENYKHMTDHGELVASKSEEIIANMLFAQGITYEYERPMQMGDQKVIPDFLLWMPNGEKIIWEHAGLMDNKEYADKFEKKLSIYEKAGYTRTKNLIVTWEDNGNFSAEEARRMIALYRLI